MATGPTPVKHSTKSFWRGGDLHKIDDHRDAQFPSEADIVIVGAGYAGASLTYHLLEKNKDLSIVILEAREACSGATGRNGGHLKPDPFIRAANVLPKHGLKAAQEVSSFEMRHLKAIGDLVKREGIDDCDLVLTRCIDVCLDDEVRDDLKAKLDSVSEVGVPVDDIFYCSDKTAEGFSGVKGARGVFSNTAGHLWPYRLVSSLLAKAVGQGVNLQTHTPVSGVSSRPDSSGRWAVDTDRGSISAKKVIYASNGYTSATIPELKGKVVPVRGICSRIVCPSSPSPLLNNSYVLRMNDWEYPEAHRYARRTWLTILPNHSKDYLIPRTDGSIIVGGARRDFYHQLDSWFDVHDDSKLMETAKNYFDGYMQRHFHGWEKSGAYTESVWTGIMGYTSDGLPFIGEVPDKPGQYCCVGFNGHGMPQVFLSAKAIADMVVDGTSIEEVDLPLPYRLTRERFGSQEQHVSLKAYEAVQKKASGIV